MQTNLSNPGALVGGAAGSATVWVDDQLETQISGAESVNYYGSANVSQHIYGLGSVTHLGTK